MKTLLLASTALVATAGIAAAEVKITGYAEIGIIGGERYDDGANEANPQFHTDIDVTFAMTGESDGGLAFGALIDLDESDGTSTRNDSPAFDAQNQGGETYFLSYGAMRLDMGDTDSAYDAALQEVALAGASIADDETEHAGYNGNSSMDGIHGGQIARVSYSASGLTLGLSAQAADTDAGNDNPVWGLGVRYTTDFGGAAIGLGLGYITQEDNSDMVGVSVNGTFGGGFSAAVNYSERDYDGAETQTHAAIGLGYSMNALSIGVNYGEYDNLGGVDGSESSGFGIAGTYDLGGGLAAHIGYGSSDVNDDESESYSLGLSMSF